MTQVFIDTDYITLASFLKFAGAAESGGQAKMLIMNGFVKVDGAPCLQKGKKLAGGEIVSLRGSDYEVVKRCT